MSVETIKFMYKKIIILSIFFIFLIILASASIPGWTITIGNVYNVSVNDNNEREYHLSNSEANAYVPLNTTILSTDQQWYYNFTWNRSSPSSAGKALQVGVASYIDPVQWDSCCAFYIEDYSDLTDDGIVVVGTGGSSFNQTGSIGGAGIQYITLSRYGNLFKAEVFSDFARTTLTKEWSLTKTDFPDMKLSSIIASTLLNYPHNTDYLHKTLKILAII